MFFLLSAKWIEITLLQAIIAFLQSQYSPASWMHRLHNLQSDVVYYYTLVKLDCKPAIQGTNEGVNANISCHIIFKRKSLGG